MCVTKEWKKIIPHVTETRVQLIGTRSDNVSFVLTTEIDYSTSSRKTIQSVIRLFKELESYKNCKCARGAVCPQHAEVQTSNNEGDR
jgi:hypothetical protein